MAKDRADFYFLWTFIDPAVAYCNGFWNYGEDVSDPIEFPANEIEAMAEGIQRELGGAMLETSDPRAFVVCKQDIDGDKAARVAKSFWLQIGFALLNDRQRKM